MRRKGNERNLGKLHRPHPLVFARAHMNVVGRVALVLLTLSVCAFPVFFISNAISYIPLLAALLIIAISYGYLRVLVHSLEFSEDSLLPSCERGKSIEFVIDFKNRCPLVFLRVEPYFYISDLFGEVDAIIPAVMTLMPFEKRDFRFDAQFDHIGNYSAGVHKIVVYDLLGLFSHTIVNAQRHRIDVLPQILELTNADLSNVSVQESRRAFQPIVTDDMDYAGVREYAWGDPLKTIHWKLSARASDETYYTRLFETFGNPGVSIILDSTSSSSYDHEELMQVFDALIESALSLNEFARNNGIDSELLYLNRDGERSKMHLLGLADSMSLIEDIPRIDTSGSRDGIDMLREEGNSIYAQGNIAFCTSRLDDEVISSLIEIKLHQRTPLLFVVVPHSLEGEQRARFLSPLNRLEEAQIAYYVVSSAEELVMEAA